MKMNSFKNLNLLPHCSSYQISCLLATLAIIHYNYRTIKRLATDYLDCSAKNYPSKVAFVYISPYRETYTKAICDWIKSTGKVSY